MIKDEQKKEYYKKFRKGILEKKKEYYKRFRESILEKTKLRYQKNRLNSKWREKDREKSKRDYMKHKKARLEKNKNYYQKHKKEKTDYHRKRYQNSKKTRIKDNLRGFSGRKLKKSVFERDNQKCVGCGEKAVEIHHIRYRKYSGDIISVCLKCHQIADNNQNKWNKLSRNEVTALLNASLKGVESGEKVSKKV